MFLCVYVCCSGRGGTIRDTKQAFKYLIPFVVSKSSDSPLRGLPKYSVESCSYTHQRWHSWFGSQEWLMDREGCPESIPSFTVRSSTIMRFKLISQLLPNISFISFILLILLLLLLIILPTWLFLLLVGWFINNLFELQEIFYKANFVKKNFFRLRNIFNQATWFGAPVRPNDLKTWRTHFPKVLNTSRACYVRLKNSVVGSSLIVSRLSSFWPNFAENSNIGHRAPTEPNELVGWRTYFWRAPNTYRASLVRLINSVVGSSLTVSGLRRFPSNFDKSPVSIAYVRPKKVIDLIRGRTVHIPG